MSGRDVVIEHAKLFTALDERAIADGAVWTSGNTIRYAGAQSGLPAAPPSAERIDARGQFVMPGMTETHAHLSFADASPFAIGARSPIARRLPSSTGGRAPSASSSCAPSLPSCCSSCW